MLLVLPAAAALLPGCGAPQYPKENYYRNRAAWVKVIEHWKRKYKHGLILIPRRPQPQDEYIHPQIVNLKDPSRFRVAVVGAFRQNDPAPMGTYRPSALGAGVVTRYSRILWSGDEVQGARLIDGRARLLQGLESQLAGGPGFTVVDRSSLNLVLDERRLRRAYSAPREVLGLRKIKGANAIVIASVRELDCFWYSITPLSGGARSLVWNCGRRATVGIRMIDVSDAKLLWSAWAVVAPENVLVLPTMMHRKANEELPTHLTAFPGAPAEEASQYLVQRLVQRMKARTWPWDFDNHYPFVASSQTPWAGSKPQAKSED